MDRNVDFIANLCGIVAAAVAAEFIRRSIDGVKGTIIAGLAAPLVGTAARTAARQLLASSSAARA